MRDCADFWAGPGFSSGSAGGDLSESGFAGLRDYQDLGCLNCDWGIAVIFGLGLGLVLGVLVGICLNQDLQD